VTHELGIINAVVLKVPVQALQGLQHNPNVKLFPNSSLEVAGLPGWVTTTTSFSADSC